MAYSREQIQRLFQSQFDQTAWTDFIIKFFKAQTLRRVPEPLDIDESEGQGYYWGKLSTGDDYEISFFYLKMNRSIDQRRVGLRQLVNRYIKIDSDAGIAVFDDGKHWRLSFITDMRGEKTSPKRYTFVFGDAEKYYHTAVDRFLELQRTGISYKNIREAFSVEALTKQFYNDLFDWYTWALDPSTGVYFPNNPSTNADDTHQLDTKLIRLITRLMFVWFIKQKNLVPANLFDQEELKLYLKNFDPMSMDSANYYQGILQNLFFATLNRPIKNITYDKDGHEFIERRGFAHLKDKPDVKSLYRYQELFKISEEQITRLFEFIPFINGGLFECLDKNKTSDGVDQAYFDDGFSRNNTIRDGHWTRRAFVPNKLFFDPEDGIISIFNRYNFTVEENSPSEQQVALDPELLGKVFENLLGAYNPETEQTARNQSGSFYTPREIVSYMVDISLQSYLGDTDEVKALFADDFEYDESKREYYNKVIEKLKAIKVLDPACGSGAFPIGMLNRIVQLLQNLKAPGSKYDLKLQIMENCIYGGDIQTIAAQITKLRFFISLVCDCEKSDNSDENYGIPNLPNLETHFVSCDSLIALKKPNQYNLFEQDVIALKKKLQAVRHEHFMAKTVYQKTKLRNRDKELRDELAQMLTDDNVIASADAKQLVAWNPYDQNGKASFFDPEWMFGIKDGFDVVIGNPPYINLRGDLGLKYKKCNYKSFSSVGDIYCLFYEKGVTLLKPKGHLCYITSSSWMKTDAGSSIREILSKGTRPCILIDFNGVQMFESATVNTNILLTQKDFLSEQRETTSPFVCTVARKSNSYVIKNDLRKYVEDTFSLFSMPTNGDVWIVMTKEEARVKSIIQSMGTPLKEWNVRVNIGIMTFCNPAFIITGERRKEILSWCNTKEEKEKVSQIISPILRGRDIQRYTYKYADVWLINTHNGIPGKFERIRVEDYPAIKKHLDCYYSQISSRATQGQTPYNLRSCAYLEDFYSPKVIWKRIGSILRFSYDEKKMFGLDSTCFLSGRSEKFICCILNSPVGHFLLKDSPMTGTGDLIISVQAINPICVPDNIDEQPFNNLVDKIIRMKQDRPNADTKIIEKEIDELVYQLYGLGPNEINVILQSLQN